MLTSLGLAQQRKPQAPAVEPITPDPAEAKMEEDDYITVDDGFVPHNNFVNALLTDLYEITMTNSYFSLGKHKMNAVFDMFFRKCPFKGEFVTFCGLEDVLRFVKNFRFNAQHIAFLKKQFPSWTPEFFDYLSTLDASEVEIHAIDEGTVVYPRTPLIRIEGPLGVVQLLETTVLNLVNYPTLVSTCAARHRILAGNKVLLEFGLRRAQGADGGMSASRYSYIGGYNGSSNVLASLVFDVPAKGTHAHSYVSSFKSFRDIPDKLQTIKSADGKTRINLLARVKEWRKTLDPQTITNEGELAAFSAYALEYPGGFLALIDTYDTHTSGMVNFAIVAMALLELGYRPIGIRIDSGNLIQQSFDIRAYFDGLAQRYKQDAFKKFGIIASNDIDETMLDKLQESEVTGYGIGTRLVTCKGNPALGGVYKLVEINSEPRIKLSSERFKTTIPGKKNVYRMYGQAGDALCDVLTMASEKPPQPKQQLRCRDFFNPSKRIMVEPTKVEPLLKKVWSKRKVTTKLPNIHKLRERCVKNLQLLPPERTRRNDPESYKVLLTEALYASVQKLMDEEAPVMALK